ncbi:uncharacterized protein N0V96_006528 [Colletotrichum fioriniae]|uniref:uncharacterized protein n=1 Tax=Colletotrichum fioriniae TaxID=710243 RepID=UPI0032DAAAE3|nr:hypothetical protein N0V96_006528 [Colletotrichum fioriniae]
MVTDSAFTLQVEQYQTVLNDLAGVMTSIHKDFLADDSSKQINVNGELRKSVHGDMKSLVTKTLPSMETLFTDLQESVEQDVFLDIYPRFVRYQMALSATRAFLQGAHTDRVPVRRLKNAIDERKESVELILNYKKNGDPFWNLLYVGSQPSARKAFLKALGMKVSDDHAPNGIAADPGMESKLLHKLEGRDLSAQMKEFYTAYSKYLIVSYDSFIIKFYSEGVLEMLHPANNTVGLVAGQEVFRFLKQNMVNHQSDYKTRVRNALRTGAPISVEVRLQTRRSALFRGDERFVTHWTPLKDEKSQVHWAVVTLAPAIE